MDLQNRETQNLQAVRSSERAGHAAISVIALNKSFGSVKAVVDMTLQVRAGEVVAFLGPNGAGKTSTIDIILGLSKPTTGLVSIFGMTPSKAVRTGMVSAVMQSGGLLKDLTVNETLQYASYLYMRPKPVAEVLERAGITHIGSRLVGKCSGGEQQRLRFAMALLADPELLILDEPTQGMDVEGRRDFWAAIRHDAAMGRTILFATHYLEEADSYADRIVLVRRGQIVADGTASEVKSLTSGRTVRATFPGADQAQLKELPGVQVVKVQGDNVLIRSADTDSVARFLLTKTSARDLEIVSVGLEEAFLALTSDEAEAEGDPKVLLSPHGEGTLDIRREAP